MVTGLDILPAKEIIMQPAGIINEKAVEQSTAPVVPITEPIVYQNEQQVDNLALPNTSFVSTEVKNETSGEISDENPQEPNKS